MRPCDRYIQSGLIYRINFNFNFYTKYVVIKNRVLLLESKKGFYWAKLY